MPLGDDRAAAILEEVEFEAERMIKDNNFGHLTETPAEFWGAARIS